MSHLVAGGKPLTIYLIAGEASGDLIGAHLMRSIKAHTAQPVYFHGVGGDKMQAEGLKSLFPFYELSMLGAVEVLPYLYNTFARIRSTVEDILVKQPDIIITIDSPGFNFRIARRLREHKFKGKMVHYVAPTVWVYKPERAQWCKDLFDHLLVLLPFEPPYFEKVGLPTTWVGHPAVVESVVGNGAAFREKHALGDAPLFCLMPGSRKTEVERHMPVFAQALTILGEKYPDLAMAVAVPANVMPYAAPFFKTCPFRAIVTSNEQEKKDAIAASTLAIVKSGTVALEVARATIPMIVTYKVHPLTAYYLRRMKISSFANLINILEGKEVIPELLQEMCTPLMIASAADELLSHPDRQEEQKAHQKHALDCLTPEGNIQPSDIAARAVLSLL